MVGPKLDLAAVEATAWGMDGTVNCDRRDTRGTRAGGAATAGAAVAAGDTGAAEDATAADFFMGVDAGVGATGRPAALVVGVEEWAAGFLTDALEATGAAAGFFLAGTGAFAASAFLTAGAAFLPAAALGAAVLGTGFALAAGFFTVTGSFDLMTW